MADAQLRAQVVARVNQWGGVVCAVGPGYVDRYGSEAAAKVNGRQVKCVAARNVHVYDQRAAFLESQRTMTAALSGRTSSSPTRAAQPLFRRRASQRPTPRHVIIECDYFTSICLHSRVNYVSFSNLQAATNGSRSHVPITHSHYHILEIKMI